MGNEFDEAFEGAEPEEREFVELPPITTLHLKCVDKRGIKYEGTFVFKVPNMRDEMLIGVRKTELLPINVTNDPNAFMLAEMIAYLDVTLQKGEDGKRIPKWWKPLDFYDPTPIAELYKEAIAYAKRFRGEPDADGRGDAAGDSEEPETDGRSDVDGDVQPPQQRRTILRTDSAGSASASASRGGGSPRTS